jgi:peptidoglycan hydrolase-like protein with peptidoglycan-binding domain
MNSLTFAATLALGTIAWASGPTPPTTNTAPAKKATAAAAVREAPVTAAVAKKPATNTAAAGRHVVSKAPVVRTSWRNRQSAPTADRYREIQEALASRGYLSSEEANGAWGASSTDALKKFQSEQTLETTGRIDSLSLIALGLGPKHDSLPPRVVVVDGNFQLESGRN